MIIDLERTCPECEGTGTIVSEDTGWSEDICSKCEGDGQIPTEAGAEILEFVKKHMR